LASLTLDPKRFLKSQLCVVGVLLVLHALGRYLRFGLGYDYAWGFVPLFNLNDEMNFPTLYSSALFLIAAGLFWVIANLDRQSGGHYFRYWWGLATIFGFLACDEMLILHERLDAPLRGLLVLPSFLHYAWVVPYSLGLVFGGVIYRRFFFDLDPETRSGLLLSAGVFLTGALLLEMVGSAIVSGQGVFNAPYLIVATGEELLELCGLILLNYALLKKIAAGNRTLQIRFAPIEEGGF